MRRLGVSQSRGRGLRVCSVQEHSYFLHPSVVVARRGGGGGGGGGVAVVVRCTTFEIHLWSNFDNLCEAFGQGCV